MMLGNLALQMFETMLDLCGQPITGENGVQRQCVLGSVKQDAAMRETGFKQRNWAQATVRRTDFVALAIDPEERSLVTVAGKQMHVRDIEDDPADPLVRFRLEAAHHRT
jgi:hypothetical protein